MWVGKADESSMHASITWEDYNVKISKFRYKIWSLQFLSNTPEDASTDERSEEREAISNEIVVWAPPIGQVLLPKNAP